MNTTGKKKLSTLSILSFVRGAYQLTIQNFYIENKSTIYQMLQMLALSWNIDSLKQTKDSLKKSR